MPKAKPIVGDELGPNNSTPLESGRWLNSVKVDAVINAAIDAEHQRKRKDDKDK